MGTSAAKPSAFIKPTLDTRYHIDYGWWDRSTEDLRTYQLSHLLPEQRERLLQSADSTTIDFIDPETAEVTRMDAVQMAIRQAVKDPNFITPQTPMVEGLFRVFLANGNRPLSPNELEPLIHQPAAKILRFLSGRVIYKGIRPVHE